MRFYITAIAKRMEGVPKDREDYIFCGSGMRSMVAASFLKARGWKSSYSCLKYVLFVKSFFFLLESAPYGSEKAFGLLNAAAVSSKMEVAVGLYGDGVYLALAGQNGRALGLPNHSDILYAYAEMRILAHEISLADRGLMRAGLVERVELMDEEKFLEEMLESDGIILL